MPKKRSTYGSSYFGREKQRKLPSPVPYLLVALLAVGGLAYFHLLVFKSLHGSVVNGYSGAPMTGVLLKVTQDPGSTAEPVTSTLTLTATTTVDGSFNFDKLPPEPVLSVDVDGFTPQQITVSNRSDVQIRLVPSRLTGLVTSSDGKPVGGATIWSGPKYVQAGADGAYSLNNLAADRKLVVKAPGYRSASLEVGKVLTQNLTLEPFVARAVYINADSVATPGKLGALLNLVDSTELTAVVIDIKADNSGLILYDSKLPVVQQMGVSKQIIPDLDGLLTDLKKRKIYAIARLSVFWDQALTNARPDWALKSKKAPGQVWVDAYGKRWANPYVGEVWDYNLDIAKEAAQRGFDEILFDNTHFPSDGDLEDIDYGPTQVGRKRADAIAGFLDKAYRTLSPMGIYTSYNAFGLTPYVQDDMGIGQQFESIAAHVDYVCPDIYPANFSDGFMGFPKPAEHPAEVVASTMKAATGRIAGAPSKLRPWLQDFSNKVKYEAPQVRAEIDAAEQNGAVGWMLWNFGNVYTEGALKRP